jgi:hypothetical protein
VGEISVQGDGDGASWGGEPDGRGGFLEGDAVKDCAAAEVGGGSRRRCRRRRGTAPPGEQCATRDEGNVGETTVRWEEDTFDRGDAVFSMNVVEEADNPTPLLRIGGGFSQSDI